jgi:hypothetical protein
LGIKGIGIDSIDLERFYLCTLKFPIVMITK